MRVCSKKSTSSKTEKSSEGIAPAPKVNTHLAKVKAYPPGRPIEEVKRELGLESVIKLASNENPLGPSPKALKAMAEFACEMNLYPDGAAFYLKQAISKHLGFPSEWIMVGNGSDELIALLGMTYLNSKNEMITSDYAFVRYSMATELAGAKTVFVPMKNMRHDLDAIVSAITPKTAMICLDLPGNPTGSINTKKELTQFLAKVPPSVIVILDQAYFEYAAHDETVPNGLEYFKKCPNLIVARTFSKAYGLAGLRVGYAVARPEIVADIERIRPPFNVNRLAQIAAVAAIDDTTHLRKSVETTLKGMIQIQKGLESLGLKSWPSWANFILVDVGVDGMAIFDALQHEGVIVRPMKGYGLPTMIRISIGTNAENRRCLAALKVVLKSVKA